MNENTNDKGRKGYVALYRDIFDWEWVDDDATFSCFVKLLLLVNYQDKRWHGIVIKRGSTVSSINHLCDSLHMKRDKLKRCLKNLEECGTITMEVVPHQYHIITITNYDKYQYSESEQKKQIGENINSKGKKGYVALYRDIFDWEWIDDDATFSCFVKLLLLVNYKDKVWQGIVIKQGSTVGSIKDLCEFLHMKRDKLKRCLENLEECGTITVDTEMFFNYLIITVVNYYEYQRLASERRKAVDTIEYK